MPAYLNFVGDNKCMSQVTKGTLTHTIPSDSVTLQSIYIDGDIGDNAVISVCQHIESGDIFLNNIYTTYMYDSQTDKTQVGFFCDNRDNNSGTVHLNYCIMFTD